MPFPLSLIYTSIVTSSAAELELDPGLQILPPFRIKSKSYASGLKNIPYPAPSSKNYLIEITVQHFPVKPQIIKYS